MTLSKFYVNIEPPQSKKVLWIKPLKDGFALYIWFKDKWQLLKILDDNGTPIIWDDITLDFYTKEEIDNKLADILGLDAEGIAELKALIEDGDALTGLLPEIESLSEKVDDLETALNEADHANFYEEAESAGTGKWITPTSTSHLTFSEQMRTCNISPVTIDGESYSYGLSILDAFNQQNPPVTVHVEDAGIVTFYIIGDSTIYANQNITVKTKLDSESTYVTGETYNVSTQGYGIKIPVEMSSSGNIVLEYRGNGDIHDGSIYGVISMITYEGKEKHLINVGALKSSVDQLIPTVNNLVASAETKLNFVAATTTNYTALKNTYYRHGTLESLSITLPSDSLSAGDVCVFSFTTSSSFPSGGFTLSSVPYTQKKMKDFTIEAGKIYEVTALYNGAMWLVTVTEFE